MVESTITNLQIDCPSLPKEIWAAVFAVTLKTSPPTVLSLNLVAKFSNVLINKLSQAMLQQRYGEQASHIFLLSHAPSYSACFFKNIQRETLRLAKSRLLESTAQQKHFDFSEIMINQQGCLFPTNLWNFITEQVNARDYESLQKIHIICSQNHPHIVELIVDSIYLKTAETYSPMEIVELQTYIPTRLDRLFSYLISGIGKWSLLEPKSLIAYAAEFKNSSLVEYLQSSNDECDFKKPRMS